MEKIKWYQWLLAKLYTLWAAIARRSCMRHLYDPTELANLYTHFWLCVRKPAEIKDGKYIKHGEWIFECKECGLRMGKGLVWLERYERNVAGYWVNDLCENIHWFIAAEPYTHPHQDGEEHAYSDRTCREHQIKSIIL